MDTFVEFVNAIDGHPLLVRVGAINQIIFNGAHECDILFDGEDGCSVKGGLSEALGRINDAMMMTAAAEAAMTK